MALIKAIPVIVQALTQNLPRIITCILNGVLDALPLLLDAAVELFFALIDAIPLIVAELAKALPKIIEAILKGILGAVPKILSAGQQLFGKIIDALSALVKQLPGKMKEVINSITKGLKDGISKIKTIGGDIVRGLWNGIKDMSGWIVDKIKGFGDSVLGGIKDFFGIKSPSRVFRDEVGKMLAAGMAEGIEANADEPLAALADLSNDMLDEAAGINGLTLERQLQHTFNPPASAAAAESGLLSKLDRILEAIERGQVLTIDGEALVGSTLHTYDNKLGQRRALAARGAL
jgi:phage-related protein